jgi:hypothetical protein
MSTPAARRAGGDRRGQAFENLFVLGQRAAADDMDVADQRSPYRRPLGDEPQQGLERRADPGPPVSGASRRVQHRFAEDVGLGLVGCEEAAIEVAELGFELLEADAAVRKHLLNRHRAIADLSAQLEHRHLAPATRKRGIDRSFPGLRPLIFHTSEVGP